MGEYTLPYTGDELVGILSNAGGGGILIGGLVQMPAALSADILEDSSGTFIRGGLLTDDPLVLATGLWDTHWRTTGTRPTAASPSVWVTSGRVLLTGSSGVAFMMPQSAYDIPSEAWVDIKSPLGFGSATVASVTNVADKTVFLGSAGTARYTSDFATWASCTHPFSTALIGSGPIVEGTHYAFSTSSENSSIATSSDGITYTFVSTIPSFTLSSLLYINGLFVAQGQSVPLIPRILTSPDLTTWTDQTPAIARSIGQATVWDGFIYSYASRKSGTITNEVQRSADGVVWELVAPIVTASPPSRFTVLGGKLFALLLDGTYLVMDTHDAPWKVRNTPIFTGQPFQGPGGKAYAVTASDRLSGLVAAGTVAVPTEANSVYYCRVK